MSEEKQEQAEEKNGKSDLRDNLILLAVIIWAICMIVFRY